MNVNVIQADADEDDGKESLNNREDSRLFYVLLDPPLSFSSPSRPFLPFHADRNYRFQAFIPTKVIVCQRTARPLKNKVKCLARPPPLH